MDNISQIWNNFNGSMYGASIKYPIHAYRSPFQKSKEDYFLDVPYGYGSPYGYPPYVNPNALFAADGAQSEQNKDEEKSPALSSMDFTSVSNIQIVIGGAVGAIAGYYVAKNQNQNILVGAIIGAGAIAGIMSLLKK